LQALEEKRNLKELLEKAAAVSGEARGLIMDKDGNPVEIT
jgi:hypothetical protein